MHSVVECIVQKETRKMELKILAIEKLSETSAQGYADLGGDKYVRFLADNHQMQIQTEYDKKEYGNCRRFAAVMGKWDPHAIFLIKPIVIKKFDAESIMRAAKRRG